MTHIPLIYYLKQTYSNQAGGRWRSLSVNVLQDWECLKQDVPSGDQGIELVKNEIDSAFRAFLRANCNPRYLNLSLLVLIACFVPIGSAECDRIFSLFNRIKIDLLSRMKTDRLNEKKGVNRLAPGLGTMALVELGEWISFWLSECKTGR